MSPTAKFEDWLKLDGAGLCCAPGGFHIDPTRPVERAIITHGHSDHARPGHGAVLATPRDHRHHARRGSAPTRPAASRRCATARRIGLGGVTVRLVPAGHILGSAQVVIEHRGLPRRRLRRLQAPRPIRRRRRSSWCAATCSSPRRPSACRCSATSPMRARSAACWLRSRAFPERTHLDRRLRPRQDAAADRAAARGRLRPADLAARRASQAHVRPLWSSWASISGELALGQRRAEQAAGRDRALPAVRAEGPLVAAADRSRHRLRLGLDARARPRPPARRRAAAGHLRPLRLARAGRRPSPRPAPRRSGSRTAARTRWCIRSA